MNKVCSVSSSLWSRDKEPTLGVPAAILKATTELGQGQVVVLQRFSTIFKLPFSWFSVCLVVVKLDFFPQSSDEVDSDNFCFTFQCFSERIFPGNYLLCHFGVWIHNGFILKKAFYFFKIFNICCLVKHIGIFK